MQNSAYFLLSIYGNYWHNAYGIEQTKDNLDIIRKKNMEREILC